MPNLSDGKVFFKVCLPLFFNNFSVVYAARECQLPGVSGTMPSPIGVCREVEGNADGRN